jgi:hypothetical protein
MAFDSIREAPPDHAQPEHLIVSVMKDLKKGSSPDGKIAGPGAGARTNARAVAGSEAGSDAESVAAVIRALNPGLTVEVAGAVNQIAEKEFSTVAKQVLAKIDNQHTGEITKKQLAGAMEDPSFKGQEAQVIAALYDSFALFQNLSRHAGWFGGKSITACDLDKYAEILKTESQKSKVNLDSPEELLLAKVWEACYAVNKGQQSGISHELYADRENPLASIRPAAIRQGYIGDCYFLSSLAAVAETHPELIKNAIRDNGDGTYKVTFPGAKDSPVTVKAPTEAEQGLYNHGSPGGLWASIMEKAYGTYRHQHLLRQWLRNLNGDNTPEEGAGHGGSPADALKLLTGSDISTKATILHSEETLAADLERAFSSHPQRAVTAGTGFPLTGKLIVADIRKLHVYTITGFAPGGVGGGTVTIRNPAGQENATTLGTFTLPLDEFKKKFSYLSVEQ